MDNLDLDLQHQLHKSNTHRLDTSCLAWPFGLHTFDGHIKEATHCCGCTCSFDQFCRLASFCIMSLGDWLWERGIKPFSASGPPHGRNECTYFCYNWKFLFQPRFRKIQVRPTVENGKANICSGRKCVQNLISCVSAALIATTCLPSLFEQWANNPVRSPATSRDHRAQTVGISGEEHPSVGDCDLGAQRREINEQQKQTAHICLCAVAV